MKQFYAGIFLAGACFSLLSSCSGDDNPWSTTSGDGGAIHLTVNSDGNVLRSTRADDTKATIVPTAEELGISLSRTDGSSSQKWSNIEAFNKESTFPIGEYKIEAIYGDKDTEGFTNPYYYASQIVTVTSGDEKQVNMTATLANSMVSIRYTDEFNAVYPQHSAAARSAGHDYVVFTGDETRPAYMTPSQISLSLTLTNSSGKQVTIQPAGFTAQARRHYIVTIGVNGSEQQGNLTLDVQFEEEVVAETVNVSLGDELFDAPAPVVSPRDFNPDETMTSFESFVPAGEPRFEVFAFGGLKNVTMSLNASSTYNSPFGNEVQLVNATALDQSNVTAAGVEVLGLYRNADKMGIVKLKGLLEKLPVGTHTVTLRATDALTRESEPVSLSVVITPVSIQITPVENIDYMTREAEVYVSTNCPDIRNKSTFTITQDDLNAQIVSVETLSSAPVTGLPESLTYHYKYKLRSPRDLERKDTPVKLYYGSKSDARATALVELDFPQFSIQTDPFACQVKFKIIPEDPSQLELITENLVIIRDGRQVDTSRVIPTDTEGEIEVLGLNGSTTYSNVEFALSFTSNPRTPIAAFTTEAEAQVPNGDFSATTESLNYDNIQVGGQYQVWPTSYTISSSIRRSVPNGWATLNDLTCYSGSANKNTWFMVPSTFVNGGTVIIRSVGYNHNGTTPDRSGGAFNTTYYCENSPAESGLSKSIGELFLGTYSYNGSASRSDGIAFTSRPLSVSFDCKYTSYNNEMGEVSVKVYDAAGSVISEGSLDLPNSASMVKRKVNLMDYKFGKKAARIAISFRSTSSKTRTPAIYIPKGSELSEGLGLGNHTKDPNDYKAYAKGSELEIDNVKLEY